jgi:ribonuclease HII
LKRAAGLAILLAEKKRERRRVLAIVAGTDEAGFGPVLGPLVVSSSAFEVPEEHLDASLWKLLAPAVSKKPSKRRPAVAIADSKDLYGSRRGPEGLASLERGVLAMLRSAGRQPRTLRGLLEIVWPGGTAGLDACPWYAGSDLCLPHACDAVQLSLLSNALSVAMEKAGVSLRFLRCHVLLEGEYNRLVSATRNKATTLFDVTLGLLAELWSRFSQGRLSVHGDHLGGRVNYLHGLQRAFETCQFKVLDQTPDQSAYHMTDGPRAADIRFAVRAENAQLPVALASMLSKYVRELLMTLFNRFWISQAPGIAPTAGYHGDGQRFYGEILPAMRRMGVPAEMIYRQR